MNRGLGWLAPGLVLGFLLGGIAPRLELKESQAELSRAQDELIKAQNRLARSGRSGLAAMPGVGPAFESSGGPPRPRPGPSAAAGGGEASGAEAQVVGEEPEQAPSRGQIPEEEFQLAVEAQRLRREQSREALRQQADLSEEEMERVDAITARMNQDLARFTDEVVEIGLSGEEPPARDMLGITHDVTGVLYEAQSELEQLLGQERASEVDPEALGVWNHVDLEIFREAMMAAEEEGP